MIYICIILDYLHTFLGFSMTKYYVVHRIYLQNYIFIDKCQVLYVLRYLLKFLIFSNFYNLCNSSMVPSVLGFRKCFHRFQCFFLFQNYIRHEVAPYKVFLRILEIGSNSPTESPLNLGLNEFSIINLYDAI